MAVLNLQSWTFLSDNRAFQRMLRRDSAVVEAFNGTEVVNGTYNGRGCHIGHLGLL